MPIFRKYPFILAIISVLIFCFFLVREAANGPLGQHEKTQKVPILMYHKVNPDPETGGLGLRVHPGNFEWQMKYLKDNGYHSVDLGAVVDYFQKGKGLPEKPVVITFDDGYQDNYRYAYPILRKYGFTGTIFVVANTVGGFNEYDYKANIQPKNKMLSWKEIKEMNANGITIGAHTLDHVNLNTIHEKEARRQILQSKKVLEKKLGKEVRYFCYPYGEYNRAAVKIVRESGYLAATSSRPGVVNSAMNPYTLKRIDCLGHLSHQQFVEELHKYH
jgi:peptidoglycan/xylan/chitin deacetylase (PgdA/CDA1 family)